MQSVLCQIIFICFLLFIRKKFRHRIKTILFYILLKFVFRCNQYIYLLCTDDRGQFHNHLIVFLIFHQIHGIINSIFMIFICVTGIIFKIFCKRLSVSGCSVNDCCIKNCIELTPINHLSDKNNNSQRHCHMWLIVSPDIFQFLPGCHLFQFFSFQFPFFFRGHVAFVSFLFHPCSFLTPYFSFPCPL